jgi:hypothetical protein
MKKKLRPFTCAVVIIIILFVFAFFNRNSSSGELTSGGKYSHMYRAEAEIIDISEDSETLTVELISEEEFIDTDTLILDYSDAYRMDEVKVGDTIFFYYFIWEVEDNNVKAEEIFVKEAQ